MFEVSREREYICKVIWLDRLFCHYHDTLNVIQWRGFNTTWEGAWFRDAPANKWCPCGLSRHGAPCPTYADLHTQPHARATFMPISIRPVLQLVPPYMHQLPLFWLSSSESILHTQCYNGTIPWLVFCKVSLIRQDGQGRTPIIASTPTNDSWSLRTHHPPTLPQAKFPQTKQEKWK